MPISSNRMFPCRNRTRMDEAQKNIQKILKEKNLVNEDLKGIEIDLNF